MRDLIVFGEDWGGLPSSTQHLMKHLAQDRKVLWVNSIGLRRPRFNLNDITRILVKIVQFIRSTTGQVKTETAVQNIEVINPIAIPVPKNKVEKSLSLFLLKKQLRGKIRTLNQPILWTSLPTAVDLIGKLNESAVIYYCGDDFSGLAGVDNSAVTQYEKKLLRKSDLVVTVSKKLSQKFSYKKTFELTHGVDLELFAKPVSRAADLPANNKPIAGFYGSLSNWLHIDLLQGVLAALPHWDFVFIGREHTDVSILKKYKNAYFLGPKAHEELPRYSQHWQVSLLPFINNAQIQSCNPLKLMEYLAVGKPIVATSFPALENYGDVISQANNVEQFVQSMEIAQQINDKDYAEKLRTKVADSTWAAKASQLALQLESL